MSLRTRLALVLGATVALTVTLVSVAAYVLTRNELLDVTDDFLADRAQLVTQEVQRGDPRGIDRRRERPPVAPYLGEELDALVQIIDQQGQIVSASPLGDLPVSDDDKVVASGHGTGVVISDVEVNEVHYRVLTRFAGPSGAVQVAQAQTANDDVLAALQVRLVLLGLAATAVAAGIGWLVATRTVRPVVRLTGAAEQIADTRELAEPIPVEGSDEVGRLATAFNEMLEALAQSRAQQQRLIQDASHELRTPLTSLRTNASVLRSADRLEPDDRDRLLADVNAEVDELTNLVRELVELAQDPTPADEPLQPVDLAELVRDVVSRAERRGDREIAVTARHAATVDARPGQLTRALSNLIGNAMKFSPPGLPIEIEVDGGRVAVVDHGPGIDPTDRPHVFERFWRSDQARSQPGSGLGLAIVDQIVRAHGGTTFVVDTLGGGATVGFVLPASTDR